jgi:hypothetical protein
MSRHAALARTRRKGYGRVGSGLFAFQDHIHEHFIGHATR